MASLNQFESDDYRALFEEEILPNLSVYATLLDRLGLHDPESIPVSDRARVLESAMKERLPTLLQRSRNYHEKADAYERLKNSFRLYFYGTSDLEKWVEMMKP